MAVRSTRQYVKPLHGDFKLKQSQSKPQNSQAKRALLGLSFSQGNSHGKIQVGDVKGSWGTSGAL